MIGRVTVFANGKIISVGTKSPIQAIEELKIAAKILKKNNLIKSYKIEPQVRNSVANTIFDSANLEKLARTLPRTIYEPEQFPGLIHRLFKSVVALIFSTGKVVIVGSKSIEEINSAYFELQQILSK